MKDIFSNIRKSKKLKDYYRNAKLGDGQLSQEEIDAVIGDVWASQGKAVGWYCDKGKMVNNSKIYCNQDCPERKCFWSDAATNKQKKKWERVYIKTRGK